jgi:membrane protease YdiL (CAAX protease family)
MKEFLKALSGRAEFLIVVFGAFGLFVLSNIVLMFNPIGEVPPIDNAQLNSLIVYELIVLAVLGTFLKMRGWTAERLGMGATVRDTVIGVGLMAIAYAITAFVKLVAGHFAPEMLEAALKFERVAGPLDLGTVTLVSIINPYFEEVFVCAYVITALKDRRGALFAVNTSVALRVLYHLYQGAIGVMTIAPVGLIFAYWYLRSGRLWPLIVAHGLLDFIALMNGE